MENKAYSSTQYLQKVDAWWRAANYLSVGQLYLKDNPLLRRTVVAEDLKINPIGHWGNYFRSKFYLCPFKQNHK
jgi:xylulose-5-phosphate/fructose-6-phosphate phosphoketolase